jgi:gluconate 5-dehydrogenase
MAGRVEGKVALVTGGASGIGRGCAERLAEEGATVVVTDIQDPMGGEVVAGILKAGGKAEYIHHDVTQEEEWQAVVAGIRARHGRLDILVNNAAFGVPRDFFDISDEDWRTSMDVALDACFRLSRKAAAGMVTRQWGRIVMISSVNARIGRATNTPYITAKAGLEGLTRGMAAELAPHGVTVNCIAPGYMATDINTAFRAEPGRYEWIRQRTPMKRWGTPEDLMGTVLFLSSPASAYMTGQVLTVDGGMTIAI